MKPFPLRIYESDGIFYEGEALSVTIPASDGEYGVWADHENSVVAVVPGIMHFTTPDNEVRYASVASGMLRVEGGDVLILVETAESPDEVDAERARRQEEAEREKMRSARSTREHQMAEIRLKRELARVGLSDKFKDSLTD
ncbi:MAG: F0F1 ATP synthase subunit epsilon [Lachnospiraceae bacterium]|nr:F0F1 ATP synthase subunit epsilon [Lachnospiraceae bacterium]